MGSTSSILIYSINVYLVIKKLVPAGTLVVYRIRMCPNWARIAGGAVKGFKQKCVRWSRIVMFGLQVM